MSWSWLCRHACVWRRCSSRSSGGGCACASRKAAGGSGDTGCPAQGRITLVQAQQPAFQFLILLPAQRGFAAQPFVVPAAGDLQQSAYKFHRGPRAGRTDVPVLVLYGLESMPTDFFRMSMTPSFSSSFLRSARISASSSRRRLASRFWRSACPGDGAPAAFSQLRSVSMQMPSSAATSRLGRPCSVCPSRFRGQ